jgi:hypothetical protein
MWSHSWYSLMQRHWLLPSGVGQKNPLPSSKSGHSATQATTIISPFDFDEAKISAFNSGRARIKEGPDLKLLKFEFLWSSTIQFSK